MPIASGARRSNPRPSKSWGSRRQGLFLQPQIQIPALEYRPEFLIERFDSGLQEQMRPPFGPLHLLLLTEALADDLVDGRLDKTGADLRFVQDWVGHASIRNTVIYAQLRSRRRDEEARKVFASPYVVL
jgi:integrase